MCLVKDYRKVPDSSNQSMFNFNIVKFFRCDNFAPASASSSFGTHFEMPAKCTDTVMPTPNGSHFYAHFPSSGSQTRASCNQATYMTLTIKRLRLCLHLHQCNIPTKRHDACIIRSRLRLRLRLLGGISALYSRASDTRGCLILESLW